MSCDAGLLALLFDRAQCRNFALSTLIVDMVRWAVVNVCNEQLLTLLRPFPRFYSIALSQGGGWRGSAYHRWCSALRDRWSSTCGEY